MGISIFSPSSISFTTAVLLITVLLFGPSSVRSSTISPRFVQELESSGDSEIDGGSRDLLKEKRENIAEEDVVHSVNFFAAAAASEEDIEPTTITTNGNDDDVEVTTDIVNALVHQPRRSRVLFDDEYEDDSDFSSAVNFAFTSENLPEKKVISFHIPDHKALKIEMTLQEINEIFDKNEDATKRANRKLSKHDKKRAKDCRKKGQLLSLKDKKCHEPTMQGPCKPQSRMISVKGRLEGVCRRNPCPSEEFPILYNGSCSPLYGVCPEGSRLYLNEHGEGICDCEEGFALNIADQTCYRESSRGPCTKDQVWLRMKSPIWKMTDGNSAAMYGECKENKCAEGEMEWGEDGKCYKIAEDDVKMCAENPWGHFEVYDGAINCRIVAGRAIVGGAGRSCRRGRTWSRYRNRCVRVYSRG